MHLEVVISLAASNLPLFIYLRLLALMGSLSTLLNHSVSTENENEGLITKFLWLIGVQCMYADTYLEEKNWFNNDFQKWPVTQ